MKAKLLMAVIMVGSLLFVDGCATKSMNTVEPAMKEGAPNMIADSRILTDPSLGRRVYVIGLNDAFTEDGYRKVQITLYNRTRRMASFTYRVEWFDKEGMLIKSPMSNRTAYQIEGGQQLSIPVVATSPNAVDFRCTILESK